LTWNENELQVPLQPAGFARYQQPETKKRTGGFSPGL
jgi:hypothetical protein